MLPEEVEEENNNGVHTNRLNDDNKIWFNPRAKCYPMYSLILAVNRTDIDLLSLGGQGHELDVSEAINVFLCSSFYSAFLKDFPSGRFFGSFLGSFPSLILFSMHFHLYS